MPAYEDLFAKHLLGSAPSIGGMGASAGAAPAAAGVGGKSFANVVGDRALSQPLKAAGQGPRAAAPPATAVTPATAPVDADGIPIEGVVGGAMEAAPAAAPEHDVVLNPTQRKEQFEAARAQAKADRDARFEAWRAQLFEKKHGVAPPAGFAGMGYKPQPSEAFDAHRENRTAGIHARRQKEQDFRHRQAAEEAARFAQPTKQERAADRAERLLNF